MTRAATAAVIALLVCLEGTAQDARRLSPAISVGRRLALVVGNSRYPSVPLRNPGNDARAVAAALERLDFQVTLALDTTRRQLDEATRGFADSLRSGDLALFYYSGHGAQLNQENYLIPVDFEGSSAADLRYNGFPAQQIRDRLEESGARVRVMILDACRDNPYRGVRGGTGGLAPMSSPAEGTLIAYATAENSTAADNAGEANGLYTKYLLTALSTPGLSLKQVLEQTKNDVWTKGARRQLPYVYDGIVGDMILTGAPPPAVTQPAPPVVLDPAKEAWDLAKNSRNRAMLEAIVREFPDSPYARLARVGLAGMQPEASPGAPASSPSMPANSPPVPVAGRKQYKDQQEYTLFDSASKETDANKKLALLNTWSAKYPNSDFRLERWQLLLNTFQQLGQPGKMIDAAREVVAIDAKNLVALYWITLLTPSAGNSSQDALDTAERAASVLISAEKPPAVSDDDWRRGKPQTDATAYSTLGWVAMQRRNNEIAEQNFKKSLDLNPNVGQAPYWLGTVILAEKKPEKQSEALFYIARAGSYTGANALSADARQTVDAYLTRAYSQLHGDSSGLAEMKAMARASATPPAGFQIKTAAQIAAEKQEELRRSDPAAALWQTIKAPLVAPDGQQYFELNVKNAFIPGGANGVSKLRGWLVKADPPERSEELLVSMEGSDQPATVTLKLVGPDGVTAAPLTGRPELGSQIEFEGIGGSFTPNPFMLTFLAEKSKIDGLKEEKLPLVHRPAHKN